MCVWCSSFSLFYTYLFYSFCDHKVINLQNLANRNWTTNVCSQNTEPKHVRYACTWENPRFLQPLQGVSASHRPDGPQLFSSSSIAGGNGGVGRYSRMEKHKRLFSEQHTHYTTFISDSNKKITLIQVKGNWLNQIWPKVYCTINPIVFHACHVCLSGFCRLAIDSPATNMFNWIDRTNGERSGVRPWSSGHRDIIHDTH